MRARLAGLFTNWKGRLRVFGLAGLQSGQPACKHVERSTIGSADAYKELGN